jgi:predicted AlkP superfamily pyrophosphatase or phosphodiesterase
MWIGLFAGVTAYASPVDPPPPNWQPQIPSSTLLARPQYVVMLILDGALPSYFTLGNFPHLAALINRGTSYTNAFDGMLETETPTGHASIGTGSLPRRHGVISFSWYTDQGVIEHPTNPIPIQAGQLDQVLKRSGVPSIASLLKQHDPSATVAVTSGHKDYAVDSVGGWAADYLMYYALRGQTWTPIGIPRHMPPRPVLSAPGLTAFAPHLGPGDQDDLAVQLALSSFRVVRQRVTIINQPEFDWPLGHVKGGLADAWFAWKLMSKLDTDIADIEAQYAAAGVLKHTLFVITADHGMLTLNHSIPHDIIEKAVTASGTTLADYEYHSAGYLWLRNRAKAHQVADNILALKNRHIRAVYYRQPGTYTYVRASSLGRLAGPNVADAYEFLLGTLAGPEAPQVVILLAENTSIVGPNEIGWRGDHGGPSWNAEHVPLVLSGPGIRQGLVSAYPATIYDIAPTILTLLGVQPTGMDGVALDDAFTAPDQAGIDAQQKEGALLEPVAQALMQQSRLDGP